MRDSFKCLLLIIFCLINDKIFSANPVYPFLLGKPNSYKVPSLAPSFASVFDLSDFCEKSEEWDYLILSHRKKYIDEEELSCALNNFDLEKSFDNVGESYVEVWKSKN